jgi:hypothetical protein
LPNDCTFFELIAPMGHVIPELFSFNPARDLVTIETPLITQNSTLTIADVNGQVVITKPMNSRKMRINVSDLARGVYFMKVRGEGNVQVGKFIKN